MQTNPESGASHDMHEADIGSGEKPLSQQETEKMIRQVPARFPPTAPSTPAATTSRPASPTLPPPVDGA